MLTPFGRSRPTTDLDLHAPGALAALFARNRAEFGGSRMDLETAAPAAPADYLDRLNTQHDGHLDAIETVQRGAIDAGRDLSEAELADVAQHQDAMAALHPQIDRFTLLRQASVDRVARAASTPPAPAAFSRIQVTERAQVTDHAAATATASADAEPVFRSAGEAGLALWRAERGRTLSESQSDQVQRALAIQTTTDTPGLLPVQIIGELRGKIDQPRSIVATARRLDLPPAGMTFRRPKITQHTLVGKQGAEKTEVPSRKMIVGFDDVPLDTHAGAVNISIQDVERTTPGALDLLYEDFANSYGLSTEQDMVDKLVAAATPNKLVLAANATLATIWQRVFDAAASMLAGTRSKVLPNIIYASVDQWARIGGATTPLAPQNGYAQVVPTELTALLGPVRVVPSPLLPAGTIIVANNTYLEYLEDARNPIRLQVPEPRILGYEAGVYGYFASYVSDPLGAVLLGV